ncbi:beta-lactamase superfamily II metal-dependent hydrolase [Kibdelosporangium banguiense]|uniref:Beta-lactamase superfamily II metal-dependent hydrolase n=1 Tax=Kibdelosporangium banguiense TaxID=1365924 RepID=A0ABS4TH74_9PSEU|nr:MBL fold metallo-hydrolase [Kibdelosporangium banguiense]MBP2323787.1 beta-lactamase superfamily II metal-dependent hydrolase [Kibdelosporangium banguiense]
MYEVDFLPVESGKGEGSKSGDAIAMRFDCQSEGRRVVVVIDGGFSPIGDELADHIEKYYQTSQVDLVISTHPDQDHMNGLVTLVERLDVLELMVHQPRKHVQDVSEFSNLEAVDNLLDAARSQNALISEPFVGEERFGGQLAILGPSESYYTSLIKQHLEEVREGAAKSTESALSLSFAQLKKYLRSALDHVPFLETLSDDVVTGPRNSTSAITLLKVDGERMLFTGDAGIEALERAATYYEMRFGSFQANPLDFFQAPHHGSRRNLGPTILNRILGPREAPYLSERTAFISSAKLSEKHPSPKVVNALKRRGCKVFATERKTILHHNGLARPGWIPIVPLSAMSEDYDD